VKPFLYLLIAVHLAAAIALVLLLWT